MNRKTYYYYEKPHGKDGKSMWNLYEPSEYADFKKILKETKVKQEMKDELRSLLLVCKKDF